MKRGKFLCFLLTVGCMLAEARDNVRAPDARALSMGGNGATHTPLLNPALLALKERKELRVDYYNRYAMQELATISGGFCFPNEILPVGLHVASFGYDEYRESLFRFSTGKRLNAYWSLGVSVQYVLLQSELFEADMSRLSTDIGATFRPVENWLITMSLVNIPSFSLNGENGRSELIAPYSIEMGMNWQVINTLLITGGAAHDKETPWKASLGMEYLPYTHFHFRAGVRTSPFCPSLGFGYLLAGLTTDIVLIYHPVLGLSSGVGMAYTF